MNLVTVNVAYLSNGLQVVKQATTDSISFTLGGFINIQWMILNRWNDPWRVASLLVLAGYKPDLLSALRLLKVLSVS